MAVLLQPLVSEKAATLQSQGVYTFIVQRDATKIAVRQAIYAAYGIRPTAVRVIQMPGKSVRFGKKMGRRSEWKKAIVTLPKGKTIQIHGGV